MLKILAKINPFRIWRENKELRKELDTRDLIEVLKRKNTEANIRVLRSGKKNRLLSIALAHTLRGEELTDDDKCAIQESFFCSGKKNLQQYEANRAKLRGKKTKSEEQQ